MMFHFVCDAIEHSMYLLHCLSLVSQLIEIAHLLKRISLKYSQMFLFI